MNRTTPRLAFFFAIAGALLLQPQSKAKGGVGYSPVALQPRQAGVSAIAYRAMEAPATDYQWIVDSQDDSGAFVDVAQTATVLRWLGDRLPKDAVQRAHDYLLGQQALDGSWQAHGHQTANVLAGLWQAICRLQDICTGDASAAEAANATAVQIANPVSEE